MLVTICLWATLLALLQGVLAQPRGTIHLFTSSGCKGSHMSCGNIPPNACCTTGGDVVASTFLVTFQPLASIGVHTNSNCRGVSRKATSLSCFQPSFAFSAASWSTVLGRWKRDDYNSTSNYEYKDCRRPDTITLVDDDGEETTITVPEGRHTEYEHAFIEGDFDALKNLSKARERQLRFLR